MKNIPIIDSHTEGEPTRVVVAGAPDLGSGPLAERRELMRREFDEFRSQVVNEPRGADHIVGALLCEPHDSSCRAGVIFFNNAGYLNMCGHGTIGLIVTLAHMGRLDVGEHRIETPVGVVRAKLHVDGRVSVANVPSYRFRASVPVEVPSYGTVSGDIAWGGNWFFLCENHGQQLDFARRDELSAYTIALMQALYDQGIKGEDGGTIDHIELFGPPTLHGANSRNFVMCPGGAYDRSPCGTGTSAKLACLAASGKLKAGEIWRQESILGTSFEGSFEIDPHDPSRILPTITGSAFITAETTLIFDSRDPLRNGVRS